MIKCDLNDTIAAISTALGASGIGIVRMSGKAALKVADKIFVAKDDKKTSTFKTYTTHYGWIVKPNTEIIDEVILTVMRAPKSYTKEDIVEINCHGGIVVLRAILDLVLQNGCRLASPGEFTQRAFLNGRIDLTQAEAVLDIIKAKTDSALKIGVEQLKGSLSCQINNLRKDLLDVLSLLEADIDFPEEELWQQVNLKPIQQKLQKINKELKEILESSRCGRILREGINVIISGRPNVGKSSLLNALLKQERSIVSPVAGTTRDTIEEVVDIRGIPVKLVDTAGVITPKNLVETKAIQRARKYMDLADLVILLFDGSKRLTPEDEVLIRKLKKKTTIAAINKIDLRQVIEKEKISRQFACVVEISAKKMKNIDHLQEKIADLVYNGRVNTSESILVSNLRHIEIVRQAQKLIAEAVDSLDNKLSLEFIAQEIKDALGYLDELLGKRFPEELLEKIFSDFCIGK